MSKSLLSQGLMENLRLIVKFLFDGNRILDRIMDNLAVPLVMTKTEKILHVPLDHQYPLLADEVVDYMHSRNQMSGYLATIEDMTEYNSPLEAFKRYLDYQLKLEELIKDTIEMASDEEDKMTKKFLNNFLFKIGIYTNQALLLVDKAEMYGDDKFSWMMMDNNADNLLIPDLILISDKEDD